MDKKLYRKHETYHGSVFSFGSGTQSTAILLLMKYEPSRLLETVGHLPEHILFADTGAESQVSLDNLEKCKQLFPIWRVKNWKRNAETHKADIPVFLKDAAILKRKCTSEWKIKPLQKAIAKLYPNKSKHKVVAQWLGISCDEMQRMKESWSQSAEYVYPLIELGLSRTDCVDILSKYNWDAIKSSCYMCPFQGSKWRLNTEIDKAAKYEKELQANHKFRSTPYLHKSCKPIDEIDSITSQLDIFSFDDECDGVCGV